MGLVEGDTARSASPTTRSRNWATSSTSICRKSGAHVEQGKIVRLGGIGQGRLRYLCAGFRRSDRDQRTLADAPEKLNEDPHGAAWLIKVRLSARRRSTNLMSAADYQSYIGAEK